MTTLHNASQSLITYIQSLDLRLASKGQAAYVETIIFQGKVYYCLVAGE